MMFKRKYQKGLSIFLVIIVIALITAISIGIWKAGKKEIVPNENNNQTETSSISLGQNGVYEGIKINPTKLIEDSRCPKGVQCIQAGTVRISANIEGLSTTTEKVLTLSQPITLDARSIVLSKVEPNAIAGKNIELSDYKFTFEVKRISSVSIDGLLESSIVPNGPTTFAKIGVVTVDNPGQKMDTLFIDYEDPGKPALSMELVFDKESTCASSNGAEQCIAFNAPLAMSYGDKRVSVEGLDMGDYVLVRLMRALDENQSPSLKTGDIILSWPSAVKLIETCGISSAGQAHSLDVNLKLKDGREVRTVEPAIDTLFSITQKAAATCGSIPVATE